MTSTYEYLSSQQRSLTATMEIDLGQLVPGHHVVFLGIERHRDPAGDRDSATWLDIAHFEHRPGIRNLREISDWRLICMDDLGNTYGESQLGGYEKVSGGEATYAERDLGLIPLGAKELTLQCAPARDWAPDGTWVRQVVVDLAGFQNAVRDLQ